MSKKIVKRETRFAWHLPRNDRRDDLHYVKELIHYDDGTTAPNTFLVSDFQRPVWVTSQAKRNHKEKKEFEHKENLICQKTTESDLNRTVAGMLGAPHLANSPDKLKESQFLYGYDITSTSLIKYSSLKKNNFIQSAYSVAVLDIETNVATNEILMVAVTYKNKAHVAVMNRLYKGISDPFSRLKVAMEKYLPEYTELEIELSYHDKDLDMLSKVFEICNDWAPDFLAVWNVDFDFSRIMETIKRYNANPIDIICDKSIPRHLRVCRYKRGPTKKVTASGVVKPINPSLQWHTLICTAKFYVIDAMCVYRQLRMAKAEEPSYSLDSILQKELNKRKLTFREADAYKKDKWHTFMQNNYPIEYTVYNIYDCLGVLELDAKNKDLAKQLPDFAGITDFAKFSSQSRKLSDALFLYGLEHDMVIATPAPPPKISEDVSLEDDGIDSDEEDEDEDNSGKEDPNKYKTLDLKGWIQLLPQSHLLNDGLRILEEYPNVPTKIRGVTCDFDAKSSYPSCTDAGNVSKATCVNEIIEIEGLHEEVFKQQNLGVCLGNVNLIEYFEVMFQMPGMEEISMLIDSGQL